MTERARKISASIIFMLGFTQFYSFLSAAYGYFASEEGYDFIWNYWVIGLFMLLLVGAGFLLLKSHPTRIPALIVLLGFVVFQGLSTYFYQIKPLSELKQKMPFNYTNLILTVLAFVLFVVLLFIRMSDSTSSVLPSEAWKTKWRISGAITALLAVGLAIWALIIIVMEYSSPAKNNPFLFSNDFDAVFAGVSIILLILAAIWTFRKGSYLLAGIVLGIGFIYLTNYFWFDEWMRYAAKNGLKFGNGENRLFGINLLIALFATLSGVFQLVGKKRT
ncbi:hypothetical protein ACSMFR_04620 [Listeria aquatica]|uniref:hypothetical protein n=1 Tax=Listeria aquatica TaxID=1494960 RepID=UPI003F70F0C2